MTSMTRSITHVQLCGWKGEKQQELSRFLVDRMCYIKLNMTFSDSYQPPSSSTIMSGSSLAGTSIHILLPSDFWVLHSLRLTLIESTFNTPLPSTRKRISAVALEPGASPATCTSGVVGIREPEILRDEARMGLRTRSSDWEELWFVRRSDQVRVELRDTVGGPDTVTVRRSARSCGVLG